MNDLMIKRAIWDKQTAKDGIDAVCNIPSAQPEWNNHTGVIYSTELDNG